MPEITAEQFTEKILELGAELTHLRKDITEVRHSIAPETRKHIAEEGVVNELANTFIRKQELEAEQRARHEAIEALAAGIDRVEAALARAGGGSKDATEALKAQRNHLRSYIRCMADSSRSLPSSVTEYMASAEYREISASIEQRAVNETTDTAGGYLVPVDIQSTIEKYALNLSPVDTIADVRSTTSNRYTYPRLVSGDTAYWTSETGTGTASQPVWGQSSIDIHALMVKTPITEDQMDDANVNMEQELAEEAGKAFALKKGAAFVAGTGSGQPWGFVTRHAAAAAGSNYILTGNNAGADLVAADDFYDLLIGKGEDTGLQVQYRTNAIFCFNSNTLRKMLKLQDGGGNYLWLGYEGLQKGEPATIAGKPFRILEDMADDGTNGNYPVVCADWKEYYRIVNRAGVKVVKDPVSGFPVTTIYWRQRLGADINKIEAGRLLIV